MDPLAPLLVLALIGLAAAGGWKATRTSRPLGLVRQSWKIICHRCDRQRLAVPGCEECRSKGMMPLSRYQVTGGGTGLWIDDEGPLVSSLMAGEWMPSDDEANRPEGWRHLPVFDLDYRAELLEDARGQLLRLHAPVPPAAAARAVGMFERLGLAVPGASSALLARPAGPPDAHMYRLSPQSASIDVPLAVPAELVPSSTEGHFHLYLEKAVAWSSYLALMKAMAEVGLLERGWVEMAERREMAMLRRPGVTKEELPLGRPTAITNPAAASAEGSVIRTAGEPDDYWTDRVRDAPRGKAGRSGTGYD